MASDGVRTGYDIAQFGPCANICTVPLIASGGAGAPEHFVSVFAAARVDGALAASVFHGGTIAIGDLKEFLRRQHVEIRHERTAPALRRSTGPRVMACCLQSSRTPQAVAY